MARLAPEEGFEVLKEKVTESVKDVFPIEGPKHTLRIKSVEVKDNKDIEDLRSQKKAKLDGRTWSVPVNAEMELVDNDTGKVIDKRKQRIMSLPKVTNRHSYIVDGHEYQLDNQWRLRPGAYSRVNQKGEFETMFNLKGRSKFDVNFDPKTAKFSMKKENTHIPLYPIMREMGVSDEELEKSWGKQVLQANKIQSSDKALAQFYQASHKEKPEDTRAAREFLHEFMDGAKMDPEVSKLTLGASHDTVNGDAIRLASNKLLGISRGERKPDARDNLMFKTFHSAEDFVSEAIGQKSKEILRRVNNNLNRKDKIQEIVGPDIFNRPVKQLFTKTALSNSPDQTNPLEMLGGAMKTTVMGEGGIKSEHKITQDAKLIDSSHLGFLDPIQTPESGRAGVSLHLPLGATKKGNTVVSKMWNVKTSKMEDVDPNKAFHSNIILPDQVAWKDGKPAPVGAKVKMSGPENEIVEGDMKQADYVMAAPAQLFSTASNLIPFMQNTSANRATMAGRHMEQAISLKHREEPLVQPVIQAGMKGTSLHELMGQTCSHRASTSGEVVQIKSDGVVIKNASGKKQEVQIYDHFPLNDDKGFMDSTPIVKVGDKVKEGQTVADSNFSAKGKLALGTNLRSAYLPFHGLNYEDGTVISESAAQKLTSLHQHRKGVDTTKEHLIDKKKFIAYNPGSLSREQADKLDDEGVAKKGQKIKPGDTLVAAMRKREDTDEARMMARMHKSLVKPYTDVSVKWENDHEGIITNVVKRGKRTEVHVKTEEPAEVGDKLSGRSANKGIVTRIIPDHEMPKTKDGKPTEILLNPLGIAGRLNLSQVLETAAGKIAEKTGKIYTTQNFDGTPDATEKVKKDLKAHGLEDKEEVFDPKTGKSMGKVLVGPHYIHKLTHQVGKKLIARAGGPGYAYDVNRIPKGGGPHGAQALDALGTYALLAHGAKCFLGTTTVRTLEDGDRTTISDIVRNRRRVNILSYDPEMDQIVPKPVIAWSCRIAEPGELICIEVSARNPLGRRHYYKIKCTNGHEFYTPIGKVEAGDLEAGDKLFTPGLLLSPMQRQMILGSTLGDGSLSKCDKQASGFRVTHGPQQKEYCKFKCSICQGLMRSGVQEMKVGRGAFSDGPMYRFATMCAGELTKLREIFYPEGQKIIPQEVLDELTEIGLAFWFMDDGTTYVQDKKYRVSRFCTNCFSKEDLEKTKAWFKKRWGLECSIYLAREKQFVLSFFNKEADKLLRLISPFIVPCLQYKLKLDDDLNLIDKDLVGSQLDDLLDGGAEEGLEEVIVSSIGPYEPKYYEDYLVYNIQIKDTRNYFADGVLVGNSNIREMQTYKSNADDNDELWSAIQSGDPIPPPRPTFAYNKFVGMLKAVGVNTVKQGNTLSLSPLTDKQVKEMSNGEIKDGGRMVMGKTLKEEKGGLFDKTVTGGRSGQKWGHISLPEKMPNPIFEKSIVSLTGLTQKQFDGIMTGEKALDPKTGKILDDPTKGIACGKAIGHLLKKIDVDKDLTVAQEQLAKPGLKGNRLDQMNRKVKYLKSLKQLGMSPTEAYMQKNVAVMPPSMRPLSILPNGDISQDDINNMYKGLALSAKQLKEMPKALPDDMLNNERASVYDAMKSLTGLGGHLNREYRGVLDIVRGKTLSKDTKGVKTGSPREGFFQAKLIKRKQDLSMRSTIIPEPELGLDEVGIPRKAAMEIYKPFVVRELRGMTGMTPLKAQQAIKENDPLAKRALERVASERPVLLKRDPVLHKYGVQAFKPTLIAGKAIKIHPLVTSGFGADFDGDQQINMVVALIPQKVYNSDISHWNYRRFNMSARFKEVIGYMRHDGLKDPKGIFVICNLEDFPREKKIKTKGHIDFWTVPKEIKVVALDEETGMPVLAEVSHWSLHRARKVEIVTLGSGRQIITDDDERAIYGIDASSLQWCRRRPSEATNQFVPVLDEVPQFEPIRESLSLPEDPRSRLRDKVILDERFGYFLGTMVGDGWAGHAEGDPVSINLASNYEEVGDAWAKSLLSIFKEIPTITDAWMEDDKLGDSEGSGRYTVACRAAARFIPPVIGHGARNKHLPPFFVSAPLPFLKGLMAGLIDTDGSMSYSSGKEKPQFMCGYQSSSIRLLQEIQHALRILGISASITPSSTPEGKPFWALTISTVDLFRFGGFPIHHAKKKALQQKFLTGPAPDNRMAYSRYRLIPLPSALAKELRTIIGFKEHRGLYSTVSYAVGRQYVSKETAKIVVKMVGEQCTHPLYQRWKDLVLEESFHFERVKDFTTTKIEEDGYDLTVPGYETFMGLDGVILSNTMSAFTPISSEAVAEAKKMYPSRNLFNPATGGIMYTPTHESRLGLYMLNREGKKTNKAFKDVATAAKAAETGTIGMTDSVKIGQNQTTVGRALIANALPKGMQSNILKGKAPMDGKGQEVLLTQLAKDHKNDYGSVVNKLKDLGNEFSTTNALSIGLDDIKTDKVARNRILRIADAKVAQITKGLGNKKDKEKKTVQVYDAASEAMIRTIERTHGAKPTALTHMMKAGVKPGMGAYRQITMAPMLMMNAKGEVIPSPIRKSYAEGLDIGDYWTQMSGARKGVIQKVQSVQEPGYLTKQVMNSVMNNSIGSSDCGTKKGISLPIDERDMLDRFLASDVKAGRKTFKAGTLITPGVRDSLKNNKIGRVVVRSPLRCEEGTGICATCYGTEENGERPPIGKNVGVISAQAIGERATQLSMRSFHCLHEHSIVLIKKGNKISHTTLGRIYQDGDLDGLQVWDVSGWTDIESVDRHIQHPDTAMVMIRSRSGFSSVSQDDHPYMLRENEATCLDCGTFPKKQSGGYRCRKCGHYWKGEISDDALVEMVPPRELTRLSHRATLDSGPEPTARQPMMRNGWLAGIYCAEGNINVRDQNGAPYVTGITISQKPGEVYEKIAAVLESEVGKCSRSLRGSRVYSIDVGNGFMVQFGRYSSNVGLPPGWSGYPREWLLDFVAGFIDGDGTTQRPSDSQWTSFCIDTTSYLAAQQLHWILRREGVQARVALSPWRETSSHQGVQVRGVITERLKGLLPQVKKLDVPGKPSHLSERFADVVDYVKPFIFSSPPYVYDIKTRSGTFYVDGLLTHNSGGTAPVGQAGKKKAVLTDEFNRVQQLMQMYATIPRSAPLSTVSGKVSKISKNPAGGMDVHVGGTKHYIPQNRGEPLAFVGGKPIKLKRGMAIQKGSALSAGPINPHEMLPLTGINKVQSHIAGELYGLYKGEGIRRRNIETVVKSMTNLTKVSDPGDHGEFIRGDFAPTSHIQATNKELAALGKKPIRHSPILKGVKTLPLDVQTDWLARLNHERQNETIIDAANQGWRSDIHGRHPVPGLVFGAEFGKGKPPKY